MGDALKAEMSERQQELAQAGRTGVGELTNDGPGLTLDNG